MGLLFVQLLASHLHIENIEVGIASLASPSITLIFAPSAYRAGLTAGNTGRWGNFCPTSALSFDDSFQS